MTGEEELVYRLCFELKKTPEEIQAGCTTIDLLRFHHLLESRWNENDKADWYAAQTAYELFATPFRVWGKKPPVQITVKNFLMKFKLSESEKPLDPVGLDEDVEARNAAAYVEYQRACWFMAVGLDPDDPTGKNDGIPVQTRLAPDMPGYVGISPVNDDVGDGKANPNLPPPVPQGSPGTPRGRKGRMNKPRNPKGA